jgi:DNA-binding MarR family transcriptional regulator
MSADLGDHVDQILHEWRRASPVIDPSPIAVTGRVTRLALYSERDAQQDLRQLRITPSGFNALNALRVASAHQLSPTVLARIQGMSSAGMTGLVDDLEAAGLVSRSREPFDRRGVLVSLTRPGSETVTAAAAAYRRQRARIARTLGDPRATLLDQLLGRLITSDEASLNGFRRESTWLLSRIALRVNNEAEALFSRYGISHGGFQVLASLFRAGAPYRRSPSRVARGLMLSAAGLSGRMAQLERTGLVRRHRNAGDRRAVIVELTPLGRGVVGKAFPVFVASHARMLQQALQLEEQFTLAALLRSVLLDFESSVQPRRLGD